MSYDEFTDWTALRLIDKDGVLLEELPPIQRFLNACWPCRSTFRTHSLPSS